MTARRVLIIEAQLKQYRRPFLLALAERLEAEGISLCVAYSDPTRRERAKSDTVELPEAFGSKVPIWWFLGERVSLQHAWRQVREAELIVIEQGNRHLLNYLLLALSRLRVRRVAYWGHGYNRQARSLGVSEWLKHRLVTKVDWWFAYTPGVADYLAEHGVAPKTISVVNNTMDTSELSAALSEVDDARRATVRDRLGIGLSARVGLFCGSLYADKKLDFLIQAALLIRLKVPTFELLVVGDGPQRERIEAAAKLYPFIHSLGPAFGSTKAEYFALAELFLMPGLVGLAIVDAFAAGLPVVTTTVPIHSPEIEYVHDGHNGIVTAPLITAYAREVIALLEDEGRRRTLSDAALRTAARLPLAGMVDAFADGIKRALGARAPSSRSPGAS